MDKKKILIVDFDHEFLKFLSQFLHNEGFDVITAIDGFAGIEKYKAERPDLVITEAMLPKLHGFELCSRITNNQGWKTPVIIITGVYKDTIYKTEALRTFGAAAYLEKPLDTDDLRASIKKILGHIPIVEPMKAEPAKKEDVIDEAILEAILPVSKEDTPSNGHPPAEIHKPEKPVSKDQGSDEIDSMLQSTLVGLGFSAEKKKTPVVKPKPPIVKPVPVRPARVIPPIPTPPPAPAPQSFSVETAREELTPEPKAAKIRTEEPIIEARQSAKKVYPDVPAKTEVSPFDEFMEPKKKSSSSKIVVGAVAGSLVIVAAIIFILKPGKGKSVAEAPLSQVQTEAVDTRSFEPPAENTGTPIETVTNVPETPVRTAAQKPATQKPAASSPPPLENIKPLESEARPKLEIQVPETSVALNNTSAVPAQSPPVQNAGARSNQPSPAAITPSELPIAKAKAGDLVPLGEVDVQPQTIKSENPSYPSMAMRLRVEGTVTLNVLISETGNVLQTSLIKGIKGSYGFDDAADSAVRKWKFRPAQKDGVNVRVWKPISIIFKLQR